jgi:predicted DNA-binding ribbon-helix-helix protein
MYSIEVKATRPWQLKKKILEPNRWVSFGSTTNQKQAECDIAYLMAEIAEYQETLNNISFDLRIQSNHKVIWNKQIKL